MCFKTDKMEKLYVIAPLFNPRGYKSRHKLYNQFEQQMLSTPDVVLCTVECLFKDQKPSVRKRGKNHIVITVNSLDEMWLKENLINIGVKKLPAKAKYICWVDADLQFAKPTWVHDTIELLQEYPVIQMFSEVHYLNANYEKTHEAKSLMWGWLNGASYLNDGKSCYNPEVEPDKSKRQGYGWHGAPGGAWAYRREAFEKLGGLVDFGVVGSGDSYSAFGMLGIVCSSITNRNFKYNPDYTNSVREWVKNAYEVIKGNVGLMEGVILHNYHGETKNRQYWERNEILCRNQFSPIEDLYRNHQGLNQFTEGKPELVEDVKRYFEKRQEDDNYVEVKHMEESKLRFLKWFRINK